MYIAQDKLKNSVVEYLLYMWQVENIIRTYHFDIELIFKNIISPMVLPKNQEENELEWYKGLIKKMKDQNLLNKGHLEELNDLLMELSFLHTTFIKGIKETEYIALYQTAQPFINELHQKQNGIVNNEIEVCLNGLFAYWMLKAAKKNISEETQLAMNAISKLIAQLSAKYHQMMGAIQQVI